MRPMILALVIGAFALVSGGCGGGGAATHPIASHTPTTTTATASQPNTPAALEQAARKAIEEDHRLSVETLWTNLVPASPPATAGPNLAILRRSVAQRRRQGVRVRMLSERFRILSLQLDPSYATATATISDAQRVQPSYPDGRPRGRAVTLHERARLELHRIGNAERFAVWKVVLLP